MAKDNNNKTHQWKIAFDKGKVVAVWVCIFYKNTFFYLFIYFVVCVCVCAVVYFSFFYFGISFENKKKANFFFFIAVFFSLFSLLALLLLFSVFHCSPNVPPYDYYSIFFIPFCLAYK